ncbi:unnamed protein product [Schistocephalus solidus]|uniref:Endonuclease/exonuclease/phosphatase domain-containing protein n=1 Tax=Schistocephalus solidus TaxID=70667 RepID=A0A183TTD6_SCHSO|nr:unnamed protein product [Schistocephalus solidus]
MELQSPSGLRPLQASVWNRHGIHLNTYMQMCKGYVLTTLFYGAETWTIYSNQVRKLPQKNTEAEMARQDPRHGYLAVDMIPQHPRHAKGCATAILRPLARGGGAGRSKAERRDTGVAFAIRNDIVGRLPCLLQAINDRLMCLHLPLWGDQFATIISAFAPPRTSCDAEKDKIQGGTARPAGYCTESGQVIVIGDFNARVVGPRCLEGSAGSPRSP